MSRTMLVRRTYASEMLSRMHCKRTAQTTSEASLSETNSFSSMFHFVRSGSTFLFISGSWITDQSASADDVNGAIGDAGAALLIVNITDTRSMLSDLSMDLEVGTSDAGSYFNNKVLEAVDYGVRLTFSKPAARQSLTNILFSLTPFDFAYCGSVSQNNFSPIFLCRPIFGSAECF